MTAIFDEIEHALKTGLYYLAVSTAVTLPDICSALEQPDARAHHTLYKEWYKIWVSKLYPQITDLDMYCIRCGIVHTGNFGHPGCQYSRIVFTVPEFGVSLHCGILQTSQMAAQGVAHVLTLDTTMFCRDIVGSARTWLDENKNNSVVQNNMDRIVRLRPNGFLPYIDGLPVIA